MWKIKRLFVKEKPSNLNRNQLQTKAIQALEKKYDFLAVIGTGAYGDIMALWSKQEKRTVAAKIMHPQMTSKGELKLWPRLAHHNIVPVIKIKRCQEVDIFLMPHYTRTLMSVLDDPTYKRNPKSFALITEWMRNVLSGLQYLHTSEICHLDLKADNIMITSQNTAAIGDFSSIESAKSPTDMYALPRYYCPPEAWPLEIEGALPKVDGKAFDIWSYGMIIFYCFSDRWMESHLWGRTNWWDEIFPLIRKCLELKIYFHQLCQAFPYSKIDSATCIYSLNLIKGVLRYEPQDRPSPEKILQHAMLQKDRKNLLEPDIIWTHRKEEVQKHILKGKLERMIKMAALIAERDRKETEIKNKENPSSTKRANLNNPVPSLSEYFCCCCEKQNDIKQK